MPRRFPSIAAAALLGLALAASGGAARAQQYWLPNGHGGTTWNNPRGSLLGTMNEHMLQRHMAAQPPPVRGDGAPAITAPRLQAAAGDPSFRIVNRGRVTLNEVYVSAAQDSAWGPDRLGESVLPGGRQFLVRLPMGQCLNDIRVVYADGQAFERRRVNTCALIELPFP